MKFLKYIFMSFLWALFFGWWLSLPDLFCWILYNKPWKPYYKIMKWFCSLFGEIIPIIIFFLFFLNVEAQQVYVTQHKQDADKIVYVTKYKQDADIVVYITKYKNEAKNNLWYITPYKQDAEVVIYYTPHKQDADWIVYYTKYKCDVE